MSDWTTPGGEPPGPTPGLPPAPGPATWPSGPTHWQGGAPAIAGGPWRPLRGLATAMKVLLFISIAVSLLVVVFDFQMRSALDDAADDGGFGSLNDAVDATNRYFSAFSFLFLAIIPIGVLFIIWMWRLAKNNEVLGRASPTFAPGWAIGGWFIPFASLVIPAMMMQQLWKGADAQVPRGDPGWKRGDSNPLIWLWWLAYVGAQILALVGTSRIGETSSANDQLTVQELLVDPDQVRSGLMLVVIGQILLVAAALAGVGVINQLTQRQEEAAATLGAAAGGYGWAPAPPGTVAPSAATSPAAWHPDPTGRNDHRYWDGTRWTEHVSRGGRQMEDPV
jgi:Domain of unknown function (DUF4328)/Protein of unknown function (DUF2510)